jgi:hypothetical protein
VLHKCQSYLLDMRTAQTTPTPPSLQDANRKALARYAAQPRLDVFHHRPGGRLLGADLTELAHNVPFLS